MTTSLRPMLASSPRSENLTPGYWAFEPKLDGWRVIVTVDDAVTVRTRNGQDITRALPELHGLPAALEGRRTVLDGYASIITRPNETALVAGSRDGGP